MKTIKLKYLFGSIIMGIITILIACNPEKYHWSLSIIFGVLFILSMLALATDRKIIK